MPRLDERYAGCLAGLAVGDAVGTTVEFKRRGSFPPVTDMIGGGPFGLKAGQWTDDTSMALCLAESLLAKNGFDAVDQMGRYLNWWKWGYLSSTGTCFDIGNTVRAALETFERSGEAYAGSSDPDTAGNGSLMRLAPLSLFYYPNMEDVLRFSAQSSLTTHAAAEAVECCQVLGFVIARCLAGMSKNDVLEASELNLDETAVKQIAMGDYRVKSRSDLRGTGYAVASLEAALWCFCSTQNFEAAVLVAANLGDDADTTAAIVGQVAGAFYGVGGIPAGWLEKLHMREQILKMAEALLNAAARGG